MQKEEDKNKLKHKIDRELDKLTTIKRTIEIEKGMGTNNNKKIIQELGLSANNIRKRLFYLKKQLTMENLSTHINKYIGYQYTIEVRNTAIKLTIVEPHKSTPHENNISIDSPLAQALIACKSNVLEVVTPLGKQIYKIISKKNDY